MTRSPARAERRTDSGEERAERRSRALEELLDVRPFPAGPAGIVALEVRNLKRRSHYLVLVPAYPDRTGAFCGCVDFARRDLGTCKHVEAVWLWLGDHAPEPAAGALAAGPAWAAVERRSRRGTPSTIPPSGRLRFLGEALLEDA